MTRSTARLIGLPSAPQAEDTTPGAAPASAAPVWCSTDDVARHVGVTVKTIIDARESGALIAYRFGRVFRYRPTDVDQWIESCRYTAPGGAA